MIDIDRNKRGHNSRYIEERYPCDQCDTSERRACHEWVLAYSQDVWCAPSDDLCVVFSQGKEGSRSEMVPYLRDECAIGRTSPRKGKWLDLCNLLLAPLSCELLPTLHHHHEKPFITPSNHRQAHQLSSLRSSIDYIPPPSCPRPVFWLPRPPQCSAPPPPEPLPDRLSVATYSYK